MKKLRNSRGETLIEVLASILIAALSVALLFGCVVASSNISTQAKAADSGYYEGFIKAEKQVTPTSPATAAPTGVVTVEGDLGSACPTVEIYGDNGVYSYKR